MGDDFSPGRRSVLLLRLFFIIHINYLKRLKFCRAPSSAQPIKQRGLCQPTESEMTYLKGAIVAGGCSNCRTL